MRFLFRVVMWPLVIHLNCFAKTVTLIILFGFSWFSSWQTSVGHDEGDRLLGPDRA